VTDSDDIPEWQPPEAQPTVADLVPYEALPERLEQALEVNLHEAVETGDTGVPGSTLRPLVEAFDMMLANPPDARDGAAMTRYAQDALDYAGYMRTQDRLIFTSMGRLGVMVEELELYRFVGLDSPAEFWSHARDWPLETIERAIRLYRKVVPVAEAIGLDLAKLTDNLSSAKIRSLERQVKDATPALLRDPEAREALREDLLATINARTEDVIRAERQIAGKPDPRVVHVTCTYSLTQGLRCAFQLSEEEDLEAFEAGNLRQVFSLNGQTMNPRQIADELRRLRGSRPVGSVDSDF
jgi:hypothetical protein